jgi:hypothetical protein
MPEAFSDHWSTKAIALFMRGNPKVVPEAARLLIEKGRMDEFGNALDKALREHSVEAEGLQWLCGERHGVYAEIAQHPRVLSAILTTMERDQFKEKRDRRLQDMLANDQDLIIDLLAVATDEAQAHRLAAFRGAEQALAARPRRPHLPRGGSAHHRQG